MSHILDYSESLFTTGYADVGAPSDVLNGFYLERDICRYCDAKITIPYERSCDFSQEWGLFGCRRYYVFECEECGWWQTFFMDGDERKCGGGGDVTVRKSYLRSYETGSLSVPIASLRAYLLSKHNQIYDIHYSKMEELVGAVFKDHLDCEVVHCGRSGDRGIDLLIVQADETIPIQVKRRMHPSKTESVAEVRNLFGVMFRDQFRSGVLVSTADHFSKQALFEVNEVKQAGLVDQFELIDVHKFISLLNLTAKKNLPPWSEHVPKILHHKLEGLRKI